MNDPGKKLSGAMPQDFMAAARRGQNEQAIDRLRPMSRGDRAAAAVKAAAERKARSADSAQQAQLRNAIVEDRANVRLLLFALVLLAALLAWTFLGDLI